MGPVRQVKRMFHKVRRIPTIIMLCALVFTIVFAFIPVVPLVFLFVLIQYVAYSWYEPGLSQL